MIPIFQATKQGINSNGCANVGLVIYDDPTTQESSQCGNQIMVSKLLEKDYLTSNKKCLVIVLQGKSKCSTKKEWESSEKIFVFNFGSFSQDCLGVRTRWFPVVLCPSPWRSCQWQAWQRSGPCLGRWFWSIFSNGDIEEYLDTWWVLLTLCWWWWWWSSSSFIRGRARSFFESLFPTLASCFLPGKSRRQGEA